MMTAFILDYKEDMLIKIIADYIVSVIREMGKASHDTAGHPARRLEFTIEFFHHILV
jgi:hypothetical protein